MNKIIKFFFGKLIIKEAKKYAHEVIRSNSDKFSNEIRKTPIDCKVVVQTLGENISIAESLGLTEQMQKRLKDAMAKAVADKSSVTEQLEAFSAECKHPNQLVWGAHTLGAYSESKRSGMGLLLGGLLGGMLGPQNPE